jgi:23S rRNA (adenine2503-C2)-methyltransferase
MTKYLDIEVIKSWLAANSHPAFRAKQIVDWVFKKFVTEPEDMKNLPKNLREELSKTLFSKKSKIVKEQVAEDGTRKLLIELADKEKIEAVIIPAQDGRKTFCISTQVGCPIKCKFCASGADGLIRNLSADEIIEQVILLSNEINSLPNNIVVMGMGEGLLNYNNLIEALKKVCSADYLGVGARRITISTSGIVDKIYTLADEGIQWNLALSLHAVDDETRKSIIPNIKAPIAEILDALKYFHKKTGRIVTLEYILIAELNDNIEAAKTLAKIAIEHRAKVNLIPYNEVEGQDFKRPNKKRLIKFKEILEANGVKVTLRVEKGDNISAACGQLRARG